ncbi:MAG: ferrous iron transport protein B [Ignavibacteriae bacterium]|nr:ferrous iron transport protein B [Ignavibacteriota bacterium]
MPDKTTIQKTKLISLIGPPNSGKTTIFNYLSGQNYRTVNYPGATVEYSVSDFLKSFNINAKLLDSPGIISLSPKSPDEKVTVDSFFNHPKFGVADLVLLTVDASQLSRHLFLVEQVIRSGYNVIVVLTMCDILNSKGFDISLDKLKSMLGFDAVKLDGRNGDGLDELVNKIKLNHEKSENKKIVKHEFNEKDLMDIFNKTGNIEQEVLFSLNEYVPDVCKANLQLNVISDAKLRNKPDAKTIRYDKVFLHKYWGIIIFILIVSLTFTSIFWLSTPLMDLIDMLFTFLSAQADDLLGKTIFADFISNGLISGSGSVLVFLPQIIILFFILGILEDTGYLARGAMLIDKPLSKIGLNGRSFVPMLSGFACAIPAIMAARTIQNKKERLLTIFIIPLLSCSARLPVYSLLVAFLFPGSPFSSGLVLAAIYLFSIISSVIVSGFVNRFLPKIVNVSDKTSFIMELPAYRVPKFKFVLKNTLDNAGQYLKKAGPVIVIFSTVLWFLTYFPNTNPVIENQENIPQTELEHKINSERISTSYASNLGKVLEPVMRPIGMDWRIGVSLIATFTAREVFVSSLALILKATDSEEDLQQSIINQMNQAKIESTGNKMFTTSTTIGLIVFFVFALQCISTIAIIKKETGGWKIPVIQVLVFTFVAYLFTFLTVNGLRLMGIQ